MVYEKPPNLIKKLGGKLKNGTQPLNSRKYDKKCCKDNKCLDEKNLLSQWELLRKKTKNLKKTSNMTKMVYFTFEKN